MTIKERLINHFKGKSAFRISTDILFYILILAIMMRPGIISDEKQTRLSESDYEWVLVDLEGNMVPFSSMKEKPVFLSFWATWCPPCRAELPNIQRLHEKFGDRIAMVLASNEDVPVLEKFMLENDYDFPVYRLVKTSLSSAADQSAFWWLWWQETPAETL